jgi:hypothetical protein
MDKEQVPAHARLALARREVVEGRVIPAVTRNAGVLKTIESIVPFTNSIPTELEYNTLLSQTRDACEAVHWSYG